MPHTIAPKSVLRTMEVLDTTDTPMWEILVPTAANDGTPFSRRHHQVWDTNVTAIAGGMTLVKPVRGSWVHEGETYTERMIPVRIMCTREQIIEIAKETARFYNQIQVFATLVSTDTIMINNPGVLRDHVK